jgi:hypothetical protein
VSAARVVCGSQSVAFTRESIVAPAVVLSIAITLASFEPGRLLAHKEVRASFLNWTEAQILRDGYVGPNGSSWGIFEFGGIVWENYRGQVGDTAYVNLDKAHIFPMGAPGLFRTYWAPADYVETVNTVGQRLYAKLYAMDNGKGVNYDVQMNELNICTRPRTLIQGKRT